MFQNFRLVFDTLAQGVYNEKYSLAQGAERGRNATNKIISYKRRK